MNRRELMAGAAAVATSAALPALPEAATSEWVYYGGPVKVRVDDVSRFVVSWGTGEFKWVKVEPPLGEMLTDLETGLEKVTADDPC